MIYAHRCQTWKHAQRGMHSGTIDFCVLIQVTFVFTLPLKTGLHTHIGMYINFLQWKVLIIKRTGHKFRKLPLLTLFFFFLKMLFA